MIPLLIFGVMVLSMFLIVFSSEERVVSAKQRLHIINRYNVRMKENFAKSNLEQALKKAGNPLSLYHFQMVRISFFSLMGIFLLVSFIQHKQINVTVLFALIGAFIISVPREHVFKKMRSPFTALIEASEKAKRVKYNDELYIAISQLRNSFKVYGTQAPSGIEILEETAQYTDRLKPIFHIMISHFMIGERERAVRSFEREVGTSEAEKLGQVFTKLDALNPVELDEQLATFQDIYRSKRETERRKKDEFNSYVLYGIVLFTAMGILINFLIVGFLIDILLQTSSLF